MEKAEEGMRGHEKAEEDRITFKIQNTNKMKESIQRFQDLWIYQNAFEMAKEIYVLSKGFPADEKYSLTDQIRRSSRSICANIA